MPELVALAGGTEVLRAQLPSHWRARVYVADGNAFFNRPKPRLVESLEILASCVHPRVFGGVSPQARVLRSSAPLSFATK